MRRGIGSIARLLTMPPNVGAVAAGLYGRAPNNSSGVGRRFGGVTTDIAGVGTNTGCGAFFVPGKNKELFRLGIGSLFG